MSRIYVPQEPVVQTLGGVEVTVRPGSDWQEYVKYEGNLVRPISPYRWFPDTRFPIVDFQKGEFCAAEEEYSKTALEDLEESGKSAGIEVCRGRCRSSLIKHGEDRRGLVEI
jgi:hypothetical protein